MFSGDQPKVTFADVAGVDEAKEELQEVVEFLREPQKFISLGARIPKGVLLVGPPGGGKTLLAKAVSGEAGVPFFSISGSEFVEMFVGVGASRVRDLFDQAKKHSPCIIFIDEIDAVGRHRGAGLGGSHDEREQTLNQMLVEMDGFDTDTNVIIMAATNRPDILDPALLRPGRFDRRVVLDRPDMRGRQAILDVHIKGKPLASEVDLTVLAKSTPGFVGADLENLVNEAAILAARRNKKQIGQSEFEEAIERVIAGPQRKSRLINEDEKRIIAYHEAGHAIVIAALPEADMVQKISIISRGMAAGYTISLPEDDRTLMSKKKMMAEMIGLLGGRASEEIVFNDITSGASNDIEHVTKLARKMVTRLGMSPELGPMVYGQKDELVFLGREISEQRDYSEAVAETIDSEVQKLVTSAYKSAKDILTKYRSKLDEVANRLLEVETLSKDEFEKIFTPPIKKNQGIPKLATAE
jgi:cell division protease FtsH